MTDTGPGIPPDRLEAVFGEFVQADAGTARRHGGSGLGLSISRRLVGLMDGRMWAESEPGKGTTLRFTVLARSADAGDTVLPCRQPSFLGKRLLIAHHDDVLGRLLAGQVARWGVQARAVMRAEEALELLRTGESFDAVLINQHVGDQDGRSLAAAIRRLPGAATTPLVLLTTIGDERMAGGGSGSSDRESLFAAYVGKPVRIAQLSQALLAALAVPEAPPAALAVAPTHASMSRGRSSAAAVDGTQDAPPAATMAAARRLSGARVLLADDDAAARTALTRLMRAQGSDVVSVADGQEAIEALDRFDPDVVLLDGKMPRLDGFETCRRLKGAPETRLIPVVLVTGLNGNGDRLRGIEAGADDFLTKPYRAAELVARVRALAGLKHFTDGLDRVESVLVTMARCVERRDASTHGHCERLSDHASRLGRLLQLEAADVNALRLGGIVHDIGKVAVPDAILHKPGRLTEDEWTVMRRHSVEGEQICRGLTAFRRVLPIIRHHHERLDGSGYPDGLSGADIPLTARVLQIVDVYDALTSARPYKAAMTTEQALRVLQAEVDRGWWDRTVFAAFVAMLAEDSVSPEPAAAQAC